MATARGNADLRGHGRGRSGVSIWRWVFWLGLVVGVTSCRGAMEVSGPTDVDQERYASLEQALPFFSQRLLFRERGLTHLEMGVIQQARDPEKAFRHFENAALFLSKSLNLETSDDLGRSEVRQWHLSGDRLNLAGDLARAQYYIGLLGHRQGKRRQALRVLTAAVAAWEEQHQAGQLKHYLDFVDAEAFLQTYVERGRIGMALGDYEITRRSLARAVELSQLYAAAYSQVELGRVAMLMAEAELRATAYRNAMRYADRAAPFLVRSGDVGALAELSFLYIRITRESGRVEVAKRLLQENLLGYEEIGAEVTRARALLLYSDLSFETGDVTIGVSAFRQAETLARGLGDPLLARAIAWRKNKIGRPDPRQVTRARGQSGQGAGADPAATNRAW